jgi:hypothetical protein
MYRIIMLTLIILLLAGGIAVGSPVDPSEAGLQLYMNSNQSEIIRPNGDFEVYVINNSQWLKAGTLSFDKYLREGSINLGGFIYNGQIKIRLIKKGGGAAHLDSVFLGGVPPIKLNGEFGLDLNKLAKRDYDVMDASQMVELEFPAGLKRGDLTVTARIEGDDIIKTPFQFPVDNLFKKMYIGSTFYNYRIDANHGSIVVDENISETAGQLPFFKEYVVPGSGHPPGFIYGWVWNDDENLYVTLETTPDNTMDGDKDYAKVYVKTASGLKEFKISVPETTWGRPAFIYTDKVPYQHKAYEFKIPLTEIGVGSGNAGREIQLAFAAYGTMAPQPNETKPKVAFDSFHKRYLLVYRKVEVAGWNTENYIYGKILNADNTVFQPEFKISEDEAETPAVAFDSETKNFLVVWADVRNWADSAYDIYGQFLDPNGAAIGENFPISRGADSQINPSLAYNKEDSGNKMLVVWSDMRNGDYDVYGQWVDPDLTGYLEGANYAISTASDNQSSPVVAYETVNNKFLVAWSDHRREQFDIYGQFLDADGSLDGADFSIALDSREECPTVAADDVTGRFLVAWQDEVFSETNIMGALVNFNNSDNHIDRLITISDAAGNQARPAAAFDGSNNFLVVWEDYRNEESEETAHDIYGQLIDSLGDPVRDDTNTNFEILKAQGEQSNAAVAGNDSNRSFLATFESWPTEVNFPSEISTELILPDGDEGPGPGAISLMPHVGMTYTVTIPAGAVRSVSGVPLAEDYTFTFTVQGPDLEGPDLH